MDTLELNHIGGGKYIMSASNDIRLQLIASLLLDNTVRRKIKSELGQIFNMPVGKVLELESSDGEKFEVQQAEENKLYVRLLNNESSTERVLETDIKNDTLQDLIEDFESLLIEEPDEIQLIREQDNFYLNEYD